MNIVSLTLLRSIELSTKFETVKSGILYIEGFHKDITFLSLNNEFVLEYSVDADEKLFTQYFICVFTVCHSPRLLQIDLNKTLQYARLNDFLTRQRILFQNEKAAMMRITRLIGLTVTLCTF